MKLPEAGEYEYSGYRGEEKRSIMLPRCLDTHDRKLM